jgi:hypothetical protein
MTKLALIVIGAAALTGCSTTQREEVRSDQRNILTQQQEVDAAMRTGTKNEVREEQHDLREAKRELKEDQAKLYTQSATVAPTSAGLQVGQQANANLSPLPEQYRKQYPDGATSYYRTDGAMIYRIGTADNTITGVSTMTP